MRRVRLDVDPDERHVQAGRLHRRHVEHRLLVAGVAQPCRPRGRRPRPAAAVRRGAGRRWGTSSSSTPRSTRRAPLPRPRGRQGTGSGTTRGRWSARSPRTPPTPAAAGCPGCAGTGCPCPSGSSARRCRRRSAGCPAWAAPRPRPGRSPAGWQRARRRARCPGREPASEHGLDLSRQRPRVGPAALHALGLLLHHRRRRSGARAVGVAPAEPVPGLVVDQHPPVGVQVAREVRRAVPPPVVVEDDVAARPGSCTSWSTPTRRPGRYRACASTTVKSPPCATSRNRWWRAASRAGRRRSRRRWRGGRPGRRARARGSSRCRCAAGTRPAGRLQRSTQPGRRSRPGPPGTRENPGSVGVTVKAYEPSAAVRVRPAGRQAPPAAAPGAPASRGQRRAPRAPQPGGRPAPRPAPGRRSKGAPSPGRRRSPTPAWREPPGSPTLAGSP